MDVYKENILSDGSPDQLKFRILVRADLQNNSLVRYTWSPTASMTTLKFFLADVTKHKPTVHQIYSVGEFLQEKINNKVSVKLESRYSDYFPEHSNYFVRALILLKSMYCMTNYGKLFDD